MPYIPLLTIWAVRMRNPFVFREFRAVLSPANLCGTILFSSPDCPIGAGEATNLSPRENLTEEASFSDGR
jgi:hypothetical protein